MSHDYRRALDVAVEAAREAGDILRADFLKAGGPDGAGEHADADDRAEAAIRARLLAATPDWSYRGEETGDRRGAEGRHIWLVDPNDATAAYLKGWRGSATSIGLLRDGVPVLGVVNAYAAPDNEGDFFAWAEGCGPLTRNGRPVERRTWPDGLTKDTVAIVTNGADRIPARNLACLAPARYRTATSIAYRLALLAAGEGDLCVCLSGAGDWDYAGGHSLLQYSGGALVNQDGAPVTYTVDGRSRTRFCFGGAPALVEEIARRDWRSVERATGAFSPEPYDLCRPRRGAAIGDNALLRRVQGCWLGQLAGDALGSMVEFGDAEEIARLHPDGLREIGPSPVWDTLAGQPTDDSELALMLARTLVGDGEYVEGHVWDAYRWWLASGPFDVGNTIGAALHGSPNASSKANGALMRQSPLAIWGHALPANRLAELARQDTRRTHPNPVCVDASAAFIVALAATIRDGLDGHAAHDVACDWAQSHDADPEVLAALREAKTGPPRYRPNAGLVLIALQNAFYRAIHAPSLEEGVVATVMGGGDTDTNGAIAGALLGAIHGAPAIPHQWRSALLTCRPQAGQSDVRQPRPRAFWPVDALVLAERLAVAGRDVA